MTLERDRLLSDALAAFNEPNTRAAMDATIAAIVDTKPLPSDQFLNEALDAIATFNEPNTQAAMDAAIAAIGDTKPVPNDQFLNEALDALAAFNEPNTRAAMDAAIAAIVDTKPLPSDQFLNEALDAIATFNEPNTQAAMDAAIAAIIDTKPVPNDQFLNEALNSARLVEPRDVSVIEPRPSFVAEDASEVPTREPVESEFADPTIHESGPSLDGGVEVARVLLADFDPRLGETWEGALLALADGRPDHPRHVSSSVRAVLWAVIDGVAPGEGSHRSRIKAHLASRSRTHLASSCADLVDSVMQNTSRLDKAVGPGTPGEAIAVLLAAASALVLLLEDRGGQH